MSKKLKSTMKREQLLKIFPGGDVVKKNISTTMFVPPGRDSVLVREILKCEAEQNGNLTARVKILEQSGAPLSLPSPTRFPLELGCSKRTKCQVCDNRGVKCLPSGVIYRARCKLCKESNLMVYLVV